jgi:hypothetical protein
MNWDKINEFVETWAGIHGLPASLKGHTLTIVDFANDDDCAFFYPGRTLLAQKAFIAALVRLVRARRGRTELTTITPEHYRHWLAAEQAADSEENRARYIESRYRVLRLP